MLGPSDGIKLSDDLSPLAPRVQLHPHVSSLLTSYATLAARLRCVLLVAAADGSLSLSHLELMSVHRRAPLACATGRPSQLVGLPRCYFSEEAQSGQQGDKGAQSHWPSDGKLDVGGIATR
jgi:hypothetical protein